MPGASLRLLPVTGWSMITSMRRPICCAFYSNTDYASCHAPLNYFPRPPTPRDWPNVMSFRSRHPSGAQFCYADGSVHFLNATIDHTLYRALSTKNGREAVVAP